ncbi:ATP-binding protein [Thiolapillus sp.]
MGSIRRQVLTWVLGFLVLALLIMLYVSYQRALHEIEEIFDAELAQTARLVGKLALADIDSKGSPSTVSVVLGKDGKHKYEKHISYQIWFRNSLVLKSAFAPETALGTTEGFQDIEIGDQYWRVFGMHPLNSEYRIYTAEDTVAREELSWEFAVRSLGVMFWSIPLFALIIALTVDRGLRPLQRLSEQVGNRDVNQLSPVDSNNTPKELSPLVNALNALLTRLDAAILRERQFTADASHELRTPLSAMRLHSQLAMRAGNLEESRQSLEKVLQAVDQSTHLVEQLLVLARMSPESGELESVAIDLTDLCHNVEELLSNAAREKNIRIVNEYPVSDGVTVRSNPQLLSVIMRNLLDNAIRYSPVDTEILCCISQDGSATNVTIQDNGPGIPADQLELVRERFTRLAGQDVQGCGLGLSIVGQAIEYIGARLVLENRSDGRSGLIARVVLPS